MPLGFGPAPAHGFHYPSIIVEVTPEEFDRIRSHELVLPSGWEVSDLVPRPPANGRRMSRADEWAKGYARQAEADFKTWEELQSLGTVPECHKHMFLQMACEKLTKAHLLPGGIGPRRPARQPRLHRQEPADHHPAADRHHRTPRMRSWVLAHSEHLAREIEMLAPAVRRGGQRPDNCEYPWEDEEDKLHVPLDWSFAPSGLLLAPAGRTFLKLVREAISRHL